MRVVYTDAAARDLREIAEYVSVHHPASLAGVDRRLQFAIARIARWPESAPVVVDRPGVRAVTLVRYPYRIFYRVVSETIEILHVHHTSRRPPWQA